MILGISYVEIHMGSLWWVKDNVYKLLLRVNKPEEYQIAL